MDDLALELLFDNFFSPESRGYLSEAGASMIDQKLGLNVVPKTAVVALAAPTFNYSAMDRAVARSKERLRARFPDLGRRFRRIGLPPKKGSFQLFVTGFQDAIYWIRQWELYPEQALPPKTQKEFQLQFESMVVLDYIIRNTDRGNDNWLIKYKLAELAPSKISDNFGDEKECEMKLIRKSPELPEGPLIDVRSDEEIQSSSQQVQSAAVSTISQETSIIDPKDAACTVQDDISWEDVEHVSMPEVQIAAIDNGLAFPFKHPDSWRSYPYRWASLSFARNPFSEETVNKILPMLDSTDFVRELGNDLRKIFETDAGFDKNVFAKQLSVVRGQIFNLREALRTRKSPAELVQMPSQYMIEVKQKKKKKHRRAVKTIEINADRERDTMRLGAPSIEDSHSGVSDIGATIAGTSSSPTPNQTSNVGEEVDPKSWQNTFQQKVNTRSPFFTMW